MIVVFIRVLTQKNVLQKNLFFNEKPIFFIKLKISSIVNKCNSRTANLHNKRFY